ncbi:MAG TPA: hypothetical protein PK901_12565 [Bacteroidia bacterium]|nr:hypothetical protein [Bacteroidia bacterium]HRC14492.1 hypothetical protein [Bacteroidia bacterium]HRC36323.1 hypothetical protein [Bacteroidia bacterium]
MNLTKVIIAAMLLLTTQTFAQIKIQNYSHQGTEKPQENKPYDSTENYLTSNVKSYIGQTIYFPPLGDRDMNRFVCSQFPTRYTYFSNKVNYNEQLADNYFLITDVSDETANDETFVLIIKPVKDTSKTLYIYYQFNELQSMQFIVVGYFEKMKSLYAGKYFYNRSFSNCTTSETFKVIDFVVDSAYGMGVLTNIPTFPFIWLDLFQDKDNYYEVNAMNRIVKNVAPQFKKCVIARKVKLGMNKSLVLMCYGQPKKINSTETRSQTTEQWVYERDYVYFTNGIVTGIQ